MRKKLSLAIIFVFGLSCATKADLAQRIGSIISQPAQKNVTFSISVIKADSGKQIYTYKGEIDMIPASNMKLLVTGAALKYLGKDFEYKTQVGMVGDTLVIIGSGDPLLGDRVTDEKYGRKPGWIPQDICQKLKEQQITDINDVVIDTSIFDDNRVHPNWSPDELNQDYAAEVCGLNYNCNIVEMTVKNVGGRTVIFVDPPSNFLKIRNSVRIVPGGDESFGVYRMPGELNTVEIRGKCIKQQGPSPVAIQRPSAYFGYMLAESLAANGIKLRGQLIEKGIDKKDFKQIAEYTTSLQDCFTRCHKDSLNLAAEAMLKTIGRKVNNSGTWAGGRSAIEKYLKSIGVSEDEFKIDDGCGLSKENRVSADCIITIIKDIYDSNNWEFYKQTLAVAGVDGTIENSFKNDKDKGKYKGKILAKTGYITGVRALSGVCSTSNGDYIFSILTNKNPYNKEAIQGIAKSIIDEYDADTKKADTVNDGNSNTVGDANGDANQTKDDVKDDADSNSKNDVNTDTKDEMTNADQLRNMTIEKNHGKK